MAGQSANPAVGSDQPPDLVEYGARRLSGRQRRGIALVLVVLVVAGLAAWRLDQRRRHQEFATLLGCVQTAEATWGDAQGRIVAMSSYVRPTLGQATSPTVQRGLLGMVSDEAAQSEPALAQSLRRCTAVSVLPWHPGLRTAREDYLASLRAENDLVRSTAADGSAAYQDTEVVTGLRARALAAVTAVAPGREERSAVRRAMGRG